MRQLLTAEKVEKPALEWISLCSAHVAALVCLPEDARVTVNAGPVIYFKTNNYKMQQWRKPVCLVVRRRPSRLQTPCLAACHHQPEGAGQDTTSQVTFLIKTHMMSPKQKAFLIIASTLS